MPIAVRCAKCGHGYQLCDDLAGRAAKCRCGQILSIPVATTLTSLLDEENIGKPSDAVGDGIPPTAAFPSRPTATPHFGAGFNQKKHSQENKIIMYSAVAGGVAVVLVLFFLMFLLGGTPDSNPTTIVPPQSQTPPAPVALTGQETPQETFESYKKAWLAGDWNRVYTLMTPQAQNQLTAILAAMGASLGPVCPELVDVAKQHGVSPMGLAALTAENTDPFADKPSPNSIATQISSVVSLIKDKRAFFVAAMPEFVKFLNSKAFSSIAEMGSRHSGVSINNAFDALPIVCDSTVLSNISIHGIRASGIAKTSASTEPSGTENAVIGSEKSTSLKFKQLSGSWYIDAAL